MIIIIRKAKLEDYEELVPLLNTFIGERRLSKKDNTSLKNVLNSEASHMYVAEEHGKLVGFISFSIRPVVRYVKPIMELDEIFVSESYRKQGLGGRLIEQMEEIARDLNCQKIYIEVYKNDTAAETFYKSLGFSSYGHCFRKDL